jgi:hypothetical protein
MILSHQSMCLYANPPIIATQRLGKYVPAAMNERNDRIVVRVLLYAAFIKVESLGLSVYPLSLLDNNFVKTFQRQRRTIGSVVFHVIRIVSKESRRSVLPRTSCYIYSFIIKHHVIKTYGGVEVWLQHS